MEPMPRDLVNMIVHDLKTPLSIIITSLELLRTDLAEGMSPAQHDLLEGAARSSRQLQQLVANMLEVQYLESGRMLTRPQPVDTAQILAQATNDVKLLAEWKQIDLHLDLPNNLPRVYADTELTGRVLLNLLDNALRFAPQEGQVGVTAHAGERAVTVSISDNGPGIPAGQHDHLFQRFSQMGSGSHDGGVSVGLGLAFCKLAVEAQGGHIWLESNGGPGTKFRFTLPVWDR
jgi:signal transduction histidine kinase